MRQIKAVFNGNFDSIENIKVSPFSRAYTFSDSVYEVLPFFNKRLIAFESHIERLKRSVDAINIILDSKKVTDEINQLLSSSDFDSGYVYYQVTRGQDLIRSHMYSDQMDVETFGYITPCSFETKKLNVMICEDTRWGRCDIKSTSLLANVLHMNNAKSLSCDEVIMHKDGILTEAGASNLFFISNGNIFTPALTNNILPGITRSILIEALLENGIKVLEGDFNYYELQKATSAWLTSSTKGMAPIENIINIEHSLNLDDSLYMSCKKIFDSKFFI
ncbi:aminotransferase class IV [Gammaproteobacteria bacterium]|jgi:D-alanine transaminase|nr:aminotransferase class IV [Gammaproteobacteria bacterium]